MTKQDIVINSLLDIKKEVTEVKIEVAEMSVKVGSMGNKLESHNGRLRAVEKDSLIKEGERRVLV
jgi:hypothetical protein